MGLDLPPTRPFRRASPSDERPSLPSLGLSISRPSSRLSTTSSRSLSSSYYSQAAAQNHNGVQLPALSALASIATSTPPPEVGYRSTSQPGMSSFLSFTPAPSATPSGVNSAPPACQNCSTSTTPLWRRDENGSVLCNACGLFLKLHGRPRPISLKTDVIKSRNRVKATGRGSLGGKKPGDAPSNQLSLPAAHPGISQINPEQRPQSVSDRSNSPISRTGTPGLNATHNIAPQHLFDQVVQMPNGSDGYGPSPSIPQFSFRAHSPGAASTSSLTNGATHTIHNNHDMTAIRTRVSELEVINDLFRGRVAELEAMEQEAQRQAKLALEERERMRMELDEAKRRIEMLEAELHGEGGHRAKRLRVEDFVRDDGSGSES